MDSNSIVSTIMTYERFSELWDEIMGPSEPIENPTVTQKTFIEYGKGNKKPLQQIIIEAEKKGICLALKDDF